MSSFAGEKEKNMENWHQSFTVYKYTFELDIIYIKYADYYQCTSSVGIISLTCIKGQKCIGLSCLCEFMYISEKSK